MRLTSPETIIFFLMKVSLIVRFWNTARLMEEYLEGTTGGIEAWPLLQVSYPRSYRSWTQIPRDGGAPLQVAGQEPLTQIWQTTERINEDLPV